MTRLFDEKNMALFVRGMETENWNEIYISDGDHFTKFITIYYCSASHIPTAISCSPGITETLAG